MSVQKNHHIEHLVTGGIVDYSAKMAVHESLEPCLMSIIILSKVHFIDSKNYKKGI